MRCVSAIVRQRLGSVSDNVRRKPAVSRRTPENSVFGSDLHELFFDMCLHVERMEQGKETVDEFAATMVKWRHDVEQAAR